MLNSKSVMSDNLAPILLLDKEMEETPEPFRMQKNVLLIVSFSEYLKFIDNYLDKVDYLSTPTSMLKQYIMHNDTTRLYSSFLADMAYAVAKELHYAEKYKKSATMLVHDVSDAKVNSLSDIENMYKDIRNFTENNLHQYMGAKDFALPKFFNKDNDILWHYANVLLFFSMAPGKPWIFDRKELTLCR